MEKLINSLSLPKNLPDPTEDVVVCHTHISTVFVGDFYAYKVKKPVNFGFLDFTSLEKRKYFCGEELRLNRRLSPHIYLDVLPVFFNGSDYKIANEGEGEIVDYAVKMLRIPQETLMKSHLKKGTSINGQFVPLAEILAVFHKNAERSEYIDRFGTLESVKFNTDENFDQIKPFIDDEHGIKEDIFNNLKTWTLMFYSEHGKLFGDRIKNRRICDCHGDLHMEHICFTNPISIIDCIEFNERFRFSDTLADIAFLLMDMEFHNENRFSKILWNSYKSAAGETDDMEILLTFYKVYRAIVRGKVNCFLSKDPLLDETKRNETLTLAANYFSLAASYI